MILKCNHRLDRLIDSAKPVRIRVEDQEFLRAASKQGVALRYNLDLFSVTRCSLLSADPISFRLDQNYLSQFLRIADLLRTEADDRHHNAFPHGEVLSSPDELNNLVEQLPNISH
jgi:hypothetical protein